MREVQTREPSERAPGSATLVWALLAGLGSLLVFLSTLQWGVNGSQSAYATDVGEIQNALPRWGTIHFTGYPLYTLLGSLFVSAVRLGGLEPAAAASLFSALWGAAGSILLVFLGIELGIPRPLGALTSLLMSLALSVWIDGSLAEVHTMSMALIIASLWLALRFRRTGNRRDLLWLAFAATQGVAHQRALAFLAPALLILASSRFKVIIRELPSVIVVAFLAPLTYLYLPIRAWQGASWTFGQPGTWRGFWAMILDTKAERIISVPRTWGAISSRIGTTAQLLREDLPLAIVALGLVGLLIHIYRRRTEGAALLLTFLIHLALCLLIWEGRVSDALLAAKLPLVILSAVGLGLLLGIAYERWRSLRLFTVVSLLAACVALFVGNRPAVLAITRDPGSEHVIEVAEGIPPDSRRPTALMALWGHDYWALTYAQAYRGAFPNLQLVDHNADFVGISKRGERLLCLEKALYQRPVAWWEQRLGAIALSSPAPDIVEIGRPLFTLDAIPVGAPLKLDNGVRILSAALDESRPGQIVVTVYWQALRPLDQDYSVGVHLLAQDPPAGPSDILSQADQQHPVSGWYPTSRWRAGEIVGDTYLLTIPNGAQSVGVRIGMYRVNPEGGYVNTPWLTLPAMAQPS